VIRAFALDAGEAAALTILVQRDPEPIFLTDDSAARLAAKALRLRSYGTLGVLLRALRRGLRSRAEVLGLLRAIPSQSTLHLGRAVLEDALRQAEAHD
jgi:predicted nucleic acid-binding protein